MSLIIAALLDRGIWGISFIDMLTRKSTSREVIMCIVAIMLFFCYALFTRAKGMKALLYYASISGSLIMLGICYIFVLVLPKNKTNLPVFRQLKDKLVLGATLERAKLSFSI